MSDNLLPVLDRWLDARLDALHTALPGTISAWDPKSGLATVRPAVSIRISSGEAVALPEIPAVPVIFPSSSRFQLRFPLAKGDGVLLVASEGSLGAWKKGDGKGQVEPTHEGRFALGDIVAIPGLWTPKGSPAGDLDKDKTTLRQGRVVISLTDSGVEIDAPGGLTFNGDLKVTGEVTAKATTTPVNLSTHIHPTAVGPTSPPTPGT